MFIQSRGGGCYLLGKMTLPENKVCLTKFCLTNQISSRKRTLSHRFFQLVGQRWPTFRVYSKPLRDEGDRRASHNSSGKILE